MRILFFGRRYAYFRNFDSVLRELAARGHQIHLAVERENEEGRPLVEELVRDFPSITYGEAPARADDEWTWVASRLRHGLDYLRYQHRLFDDTPKLRDRSRERTPGAFVVLGDAVRRYARWARRPVVALLQWLERAAPADPAMRAYLTAQRPDVVLISPLINLGSSQIDYLRAARALGLPTALCVWSWDHLSSKALIRELPDRVFVWNETQKHEAITLHGVPAERIIVTGAQCFDRWFGREPSRTREAFCREVGLPERPPFILYVCSAPFLGSEPEAPFVAEWIARIRADASARLRAAPILVRPHPARWPEWAGLDMRSFPATVIWGGNPIDARSRADYFDSLYHSAIVVGLNTSAFIEAGIVGRPVHTILLPQWHENQRGTVHFRYLLEAGGGLLTSATSFDEHLRQLDDALAHPSTERRPFIREFVRPLGLETPATPIFVEHVERMQAMAVRPLRRPRLERLARWALRKGVQWRHDIAHERWGYSERELEGIVRMREARRVKAEREAILNHESIARKEEYSAARRLEMRRHRAEKRDKDKDARARAR
jgi:hypothetical protein